MLFLSGELSKPTRLLSAFVSEEEVKKVVEFLKRQIYALDSIDFEAKGEGGSEGSIYGSDLDDSDEGDELYAEAKQMVIDNGKASTSFLQRRLRIGYSRAARLIDLLEDQGVIGPADGAKPRAILTGGAKNAEGDAADGDESYS
jgi:S-DNA-T family DNA segregation ATPase FtsK/SpoIIIE